MRFWHDSDFAIVPFFGYSKQKFVTDGNPTGSGFSGLPQFDLSGIKFGLRLDIPVSSGFWILVGGDYVSWSTKTLAVQDDTGLNSTSFTGSAKAIEAELGLHIQLVGPLSPCASSGSTARPRSPSTRARRSGRERDRPLPRWASDASPAVLGSGRPPFE